MNTTLQAYCPKIDRKGQYRDIQRAAGKLRGVLSVQADLMHKRVTVQYDSARVADGVVLRLLGRAGFRPL